MKLSNELLVSSRHFRNMTADHKFKPKLHNIDLGSQWVSNIWYIYFILFLYIIFDIAGMPLAVYIILLLEALQTSMAY